MKRRTSVYVDAELLEEAKRNCLNLSYLLEIAIRAALNGKLSEIKQGLRPCPVGVRGFESRPPHAVLSYKQYSEFLKRLSLSHISDAEIKQYKSTVSDFLEACSYQLTDDRIIIYINKLKEENAPKTVRNKLIRIRKFLKFINHPLAQSIQLPKVPKQRKNVVKVEDMRRLLSRAENLPQPFNLRLKAAILLAAVSGIRAEELYSLKLTDVDIKNRTIYIRAEIAKDFEDRVTFFNLEAQKALNDYLSYHSGDYLFTKKSLNYHLKKLKTNLRIKHMRKFFSQQCDRLGMPTAVKKILMGHSLSGDVDLNYYDFQDEEELKKIYDKYWKDFILTNPAF